MTIFYSSEPMPEKNFENAAEDAEGKGENHNPNITDETAEKFSNLESEVPFAGDDPYAEKSATEKVAESSTNAQLIYGELATGGTPNLDSVEQKARTDYINGAVEDAATDTDAVAATAEAISGDSTNGTDKNYEKKQVDQQEALTIAGAATAVAAHAAAERATRQLDNFDTQDIKEDIQKTEKTLELANSMTGLNPNSNKVAANINVIEQAKDKIEDAKTLMSKAEGEKEQFDTEFGNVDEETQKKIEEQAEQNGTTALEEAQKLFEEKKQKEEEAKAEENAKIQEDVKSYIAGATFG